MRKHRPDYLKHVEIRRRSPSGADPAAAVILTSVGRADLPPNAQAQLARTPPERDVHLGWVQPDQRRTTSARRPWTTRWSFIGGHRLDHTPIGSYPSRHDAAESCAVEAIEGVQARRCFDAARWAYRQPSDN